ncbi:MAG: hypothetical protein M3P51_12255, partial [Chloroflexota bacterium]|nr:hypothetical protein [Chloroflexota bacterium]
MSGMDRPVDWRWLAPRSAASVSELTEHVGRELGALVREVAPERQRWSAGGGLHFSAAWRSTGSPVVVKLGADANQLYWTREVAAAAPDLVPALYAS